MTYLRRCNYCYSLLTVYTPYIWCDNTLKDLDLTCPCYKIILTIKRLCIKS